MVEHDARILTWLRRRQEMHDAHVLAWQKISGQDVHDAHVSAWLSGQEAISKQEMSLYAEAWPLGLELDEVNLDIEKWSQEKVKNKDISKDSFLQEKIEELKVQKNKLDWRLDPENFGKRKFLPVPEKLKIQPQVDNHGSAQTASVIHTTREKKRDALTPVIELAQSQCRNPTDAAEVWANLLTLASSKKPPFFGVTAEGLQYHKASEKTAYFTQDALKKRLDRAAASDAVKRR